MELNKVTAFIATASTALITLIGFFIYRDVKHTKQINNLTNQLNTLSQQTNNFTQELTNLQTNLDNKMIDVSLSAASKLMENQKNENQKEILKLRKACKIGFDKIQNFFKHVGIDITKKTSQEFYDANKEKLDILRELLKDNHTPQKENALGTNSTVDNETAPKLNRKRSK